MSRVIHVFRQPDRFVAGTVGEPGDRTFYLQAVRAELAHDQRAAREAAGLGARRAHRRSLLEEVHRRFGDDVDPTSAADGLDLDPLAVPVEEEFRVGTMGLGWDAESKPVVDRAARDHRGGGRRVGRARRHRGGPRRRAGVPVADRRRRRSPSAPTGSSTPAASRARCAPSRSTRTATSARGRTATAGAPRRLTRTTVRSPRATRRCRAADAHGRIEIEGRLVDASNATLFCKIAAGRRRGAVRLQAGPRRTPAVGLPRRHARRPRGRHLPDLRGGRPRRRAADVLRDGPFGSGMVQLWVDTDDERRARRRLRRRRRAPTAGSPCCTPTTDSATRPCSCTPTTPALRRMAAFDVVVNNADRKGGHVLRGTRRPRLRRRPRHLPAHRGQAAHRPVGLGRRPAARRRRRVAASSCAPSSTGVSPMSWREHVTRREVRTLSSRVDALLAEPRFPEPSGYGPAIPWPAF